MSEIKDALTGSWTCCVRLQVGGLWFVGGRDQSPVARKPCLNRAHDQVGVPSGLAMACSAVAGGMSVGTSIWKTLIRSNGALVSMEEG